MKKVAKESWNDRIYDLIRYRIMNEERKLKADIICEEIRRCFKYLPKSILQNAICRGLLKIDRIDKQYKKDIGGI